MMLTSTQIGQLAAQFFIAGAGTLSFAVLLAVRAKACSSAGWWVPWAGLSTSWP